MSPDEVAEMETGAAQNPPMTEKEIMMQNAQRLREMEKPKVEVGPPKSEKTPVSEVLRERLERDFLDGPATTEPKDSRGIPLSVEIPPGHYVLGGRLVPSKETAEEAVRTLLRYIGEDPERNGLLETPARVARALVEMTTGYNEKPDKILAKVFDEPYDEIIVVRDIPFTSICEHHMLVFEGTVDIGYLPGQVVGLSKLARLVDCFSRRLQIQERMTKQIEEAIRTHLYAKGVAVVVKATHSCMSCRGVRKPGASMVTSAMTGVFRDKPEARSEFLSLCK